MVEAAAAKEEKKLAKEKAVRLAEQIGLMEAKLLCVGNPEKDAESSLRGT